MNRQTIRLNGCRFEVLTEGDEFLGLGEAHIGQTQVRAGRLPLRPYTQTFKDNLELSRLRLLGVDQDRSGIRLRVEASFRPLPVKLLRDHSFDPIHDTADWGAPADAPMGRLDIVLEPASDSFEGHAFDGFSYRYEWKSDRAELFYILDCASWELGGDIVGATVVSQSACSAPVATFARDTAWTTEGTLFFLLDDPHHKHAPVMTHNLPRWASHGSFDFQHKGDHVLLGVFERVELIRSLLKREPGKPELKTFDKHLFDQTRRFTTSPKRVLLNSSPKTDVLKKNLWTWVHCEVEQRARAEFGLRQEPFIPRIGINYWDNFTVDSYYKELVPLAVATGAREVFVDNLKKSAMTERSPNPGRFHWNMCCGHEYEIADRLGGVARVRDFVEYCKARGVRVMSWTNNTQALSSPINSSERDDHGWYVKLEDTRQKYGGSYAAVMSVLDLSVAEARRYFVKSHIQIKKQTGLDGYLFDSFYNLGFMPINFQKGNPRTIWRGTLKALKQLQDAGVNFLIESFGPFGTPQHGHPSSYNLDTLFACYRVGVGDDYSTVPTGLPRFDRHPTDGDIAFFSLAHMAGVSLPNTLEKLNDPKRWSHAHRRALDGYHAVLHDLHTRILQEDGQSVLWRDRTGRRTTIWNFSRRRAQLRGRVFDVTENRPVTRAARYALEPGHIYRVVR